MFIRMRFTFVNRLLILLKFALRTSKGITSCLSCYPIQLSKNRHPPKGPRFSPNPLVRVKRNVSRRLPRLNSIPSDPDTTAVTLRLD
jgi:hypothetical protein